MAKLVFVDLAHIFNSGVLAVQPNKLIRQVVKYNESNKQLTIVNEGYNIKNKNLYVVGTGKAVQSMAMEVESLLNNKIKQGIVSTPFGSLKSCIKGNVIYYEGAKNNLPDTNAENTSRQIHDLVTRLGKDDFLLVLISGGGSALLALPKKPVTLKEKCDVIKQLANSGADIKELNTVRKKISEIKGGQLAIKAQPAQVVSLILSDIVGDPIDLIASGPTVEDKDEPYEALRIIKKYNIFDTLPESIKTALNANNESRIFPKNNVKNIVIGSNSISLNAARNKAEDLKYYPIELSNIVTGNVEDVAMEYVKLTKLFCDYILSNINENSFRKEISSLNIPGIRISDLNNIEKNKDICLILGGETTVHVTGTGKGGRNQHLTLQFSKYIDELNTHFQEFDIYFLSAGTDGIDGPTDAAGAIGYLNLVREAKQENLDVNMFLKNNDSYNFYSRFQNGMYHVITGHTDTNVMDIQLIVIKKKIQSVL